MLLPSPPRLTRAMKLNWEAYGKQQWPGVASTRREIGVGKRRGQHPSNTLTGTFVLTVRAPGFYADGNALYLRVDSAGLKRWILRTMVQGKRRDIGLGGLSTTSLLDARARERALRKVAREGGDPFALRKQICSTRQPEVTQEVNQIIEHLRHAGVPIDTHLLRSLGVTEGS